MTKYWGAIEYHATGEGVSKWYFINYGVDEEDFIRKMKETMEIPDYFMIGLRVGSEYTDETPDFIKNNWFLMTYGNLHYHTHFNMS